MRILHLNLIQFNGFCSEYDIYFKVIQHILHPFFMAKYIKILLIGFSTSFKTSILFLR